MRFALRARRLPVGP